VNLGELAICPAKQRGGLPNMFTVHADKALATVVHMDSNNVLRVP